MPPIEPGTIDAAIARALSTGALQTIHTEQQLIAEAGFTFVVRWVSSLARKDMARVVAAEQRTPAFNPFLPPEADLTVGPLGDDHLLVLNKYPVIAHHLLIVTRTFQEQSMPLDAGDFNALACVMTTLGGLGFYNGGEEAGASQRHKHLQWIPAQAGNASLRIFTATLPAQAPLEPASHPSLGWAHCFIRLPSDPHAGGPPGPTLQQAFDIACATLGMRPDRDPMPPYNLLVDRDWLLLVPRSRERQADISVNALGFAGSLFVRRPEQIDVIRALGPLRLLKEVAGACAQRS